MGRALRKALERLHIQGQSERFGVILTAENSSSEPLGLLLVRRDDARLVNAVYPNNVDFSTLPGRLVTLENVGPEFAATIIEPDHLRKMAYLQIVETRTGAVIDEFPYRRKAEAEERIRALELLYRGQYGLRQDSRWE